ncbi:peptidyl-prolyl cis-trans cyclophylin [Cyclospora cayetanensis]|nr:peptidyl-prolyl cis-trans cyclophylin [Cyclospora cayetanensis]
MEFDEDSDGQSDGESASETAAGGSRASSSGSGKAAVRAALLARKQKLLALRLQLNQGRALNTKEVIEEKRQWETPAAAAAAAAANARDAYKRLQEAPMYQLYKKDDEASGDSGGAAAGSSLAMGSRTAAPAASSEDEEGPQSGRKGKGRRRNILDEALAISEDSQRTQKKKSKSTFGWNVFNEDALYRAHKKRLAEVPLRAEEYRQQKEALGEYFFDPNAALAHPEHKPSSAALERLATSVTNTQKRRGLFSRRRIFNEDADVSYINERNRIYNNKLERSFDTREIKQNFERGTAL